MPPTANAPARSPFRRHVWPLILQNRAALFWATVLVGLSGGAVATQNIFPKWLFSYVLDVQDIAVAERWRRLLWLAAGYLVLTVISRMTFWHFGYRLFIRARENIIFALRAKFFRHVNQLCLRFHGAHSSGELFSYLFGSPLNAVMQFFQHATMALPSAIVFVLMTIALFWQWDGALAALLMGAATMSVHRPSSRLSVMPRSYPPGRPEEGR